MKKLITASTISLIVLTMSMANAASVSFSPNTSSGDISATVDFGTLDFHYSGSNIVSTIYVLDQFPNNSYNNVGDVIESTFGLPADTLSSEATVALGGSTYKGDIDGSSVTILSDIAYDYLAIHLGGYETFFHFATLYPKDTPFTISDVSATKGGGLSNYRVYDSGLSEVPVPAALLLFAPALLGFMGLRRKATNLVS